MSRGKVHHHSRKYNNKGLACREIFPTKRRGERGKYVCMNTTKKSIYSLLNYMLQHEKIPIYARLCWCWCARETRSLWIFALELRMALVWVFLFNAWTFWCEHDWLARLISFLDTFSGRENSTGRKLVSDEFVLVKNFQWFFEKVFLFIRKWIFTHNVKCLT